MAESTDSCVVTEVSQRCTAAAAQLKQAGRYHMLDTDGSNGHNGHEGGGEVAAVEGDVGQGLLHGAFPCAILYFYSICFCHLLYRRVASSRACFMASFLAPASSLVFCSTSSRSASSCFCLIYRCTCDNTCVICIYHMSWLHVCAQNICISHM